MNVSDAVERRMSVRAFRPDPVPGEVVRELLERAARAASGGNLQPWRVYALTGEALQALVAAAKAAGPDETPGYAVYPPDLWEPLRTRRFRAGEDLYAALGIPREDKAARLTQFARNLDLFGAPVGVFVCLDRRTGPPQWADCGMFLQTLMLLAVERGLDTCGQEYWVRYARTVETCLNLPADHMLYTGMALGWRDAEAPVNTVRTVRDPFDAWGEMRGF
jgi:nitroreductase